jgi:hypothetical protein
MRIADAVAGEVKAVNVAGSYPQDRQMRIQVHGSTAHHLGLPIAGLDLLIRDGPKLEADLEHLIERTAFNMKRNHFAVEQMSTFINVRVHLGLPINRPSAFREPALAARWRIICSVTLVN